MTHLSRRDVSGADYTFEVFNDLATHAGTSRRRSARTTIDPSVVAPSMSEGAGHRGPEGERAVRRRGRAAGRGRRADPAARDVRPRGAALRLTRDAPPPPVIFFPSRELSSGTRGSCRRGPRWARQLEREHRLVDQPPAPGHAANSPTSACVAVDHRRHASARTFDGLPLPVLAKSARLEASIPAACASSTVSPTATPRDR